MIEGLAVWIGREAVVVVAAQPLRVLSSAVHGGGFASARAVVNLHVDKDDPCVDPSAMLAAYARVADVPEPFVGLLTGARTEHATIGEEDGAGIRTLAVATIGLSNAVAAGR
ncbi:MAG TPA: adenosylcobinamide amidohydrolase, partial [Thermoanaerobaculia bacterium]|nr:adenosylcobinamide amidohydrolase [Thermoanaerobaculia bacterium]